MRASIAMMLSITACAANEDVPPPAIAGVSPTRGAPQTSLVVLGSFFCQMPAPESPEEIDPLACRKMGTLRFDSAPATLTGYTDTSITAVVPDAAPGPKRISLDVGGRSSNSVTFVIE